MTLKNGFGKCSSVYQPIDEKVKTWTPRFPSKENPNMHGESIVQLAIRVLGHEIFSPERSLNQP